MHHADLTASALLPSPCAHKGHPLGMHYGISRGPSPQTEVAISQ